MINKRFIFVVSLVALFVLNFQVYAQDEELKNYIWSYQGKNKEQKLGGYLALDGLYHSLDAEPSGMLGARAGLVWNSRWGVGLMGQALWYDHALNEVVNDGPYHLQVGLAGAYAEYMIPVHKRWRMSIMLASGSGIALYQYDKEAREGKTWYEEIIDRKTFAFIQPTVEIQRHLGGRWWLGAELSYRSTSEIELEGLNSNFMNGFNPGVSVKYGLF